MRALYWLVDTGDARRPLVAPMGQAGIAQAPRETDPDTGEEYVSVPDVCGPLAWSVLHRWSEREGRALGDPWSEYLANVASAVHDTVNAKLRKPLKYPLALESTAAVFEAALHGVSRRKQPLPPSILFLNDWAAAVNDDMCAACGGWAKKAAGAAVDGARSLAGVSPVDPGNLREVLAVLDLALDGTLADKFAEAHSSASGGGVGKNLSKLDVEERRRIWRARKRGQRAHVCPEGTEIHHPDYHDLGRVECVTPTEHRKLAHLAQNVGFPPALFAGANSDGDDASDHLVGAESASLAQEVAPLVDDVERELCVQAGECEDDEDDEDELTA